MAIYMHATLELKADKMELFTATMNEVVPIVESAGWHLMCAFTQCSGQLFTAVDLWKLEDMNHFLRGWAVLGGHPRYPELAAALAQCVNKETLVFGLDAPWMPPGRT